MNLDETGTTGPLEPLDDTVEAVEPQPSAPTELAPEDVRETLLEMAAVVRTVFGVNLAGAFAEAPAAPVAPAAAAPYDPAPAPPVDVAAPGESLPVPPPAAPASVPVPSDLPVEVRAVTPPGMATPAAASPVPAASHAEAQPGPPASLPVPGVAAPHPIVLPDVPPLADLDADSDATSDVPAAPVPAPHTFDRHSMALLNEIAFLDD